MEVSYEVTIVVRADLVTAWEGYLPGHVANVVARGGFERGVVERAAPGHYRSRYVAASQHVLDRYLEEQAPALRDEVMHLFPDGLEISRAVWTTLTVVEP